MSTRVYSDGALVEEWDDTTRTYTDHTTDQARPYTQAENDAADQRATEALRAANEQALRDGLATEITKALERQAIYQGVIDTPNATIRDNPAPHIVALARQGKRSERGLIRLARLAGDFLDTADTGTD